jgi:DNA invertase Pin-like site-specific DNA recombinase
VNGETIKVDDQIEMGEEVIERRGAQVGEAFKDNSLSAWNPRVVREDWNRMMERLESGESDGVWVYDVSRFTRKPIEGERLIQAALDGKRVWSWAGEYDLTTADGRMAFRDATNKAAGESDKTSERVQIGKKRRARKGRYHGSPRAYGLPGWEPKPPGWEEGDPLERVPADRVEAERKIIRYCYDELFAGRSIGELTRELNERGQAGERAALPVSGKLWSRQVLPVMLTRPALAGLLFHKGEEYGAIKGIEPIVSREEWERMKALVADPDLAFERRGEGHIGVVADPRRDRRHRTAVLVPAGRVDGLRARLLAGSGPQGPEDAADSEDSPGSEGTVGFEVDLTAPVVVLPVAAAKGLEFDAVVVVEPAELLAESPRGLNDLYVALTRATQRLAVVHAAPLPAMLRKLQSGG